MKEGRRTKFPILSDENALDEIVAKVAQVPVSIYEGHMEKRLIRLYFKDVRDTVLKGYVFDFPFDFGRIYIVKKSIDESRREEYLDLMQEFKEHFADGRHMKRFKSYYEVVFECKYTKNKTFKFHPSKSFGKKLSNILLNTDRDYRTQTV